MLYLLRFPKKRGCESEGSPMDGRSNDYVLYLLAKRTSKFKRTGCDQRLAEVQNLPQLSNRTAPSTNLIQIVRSTKIAA